MNKSIFDKTITLWTSANRSERNRSLTTVGKFLTMGEKYREKITQLRTIYHTATDFYLTNPIESKKLLEEYREGKKSLPLASISGNFAEGGKLENLIAPSNLLCLDIDQCKPHEAEEYRRKGLPIPNEQITDWGFLKRELHHLPFVAYCAMSVSNHGIYLIVPVKEGMNHIGHWLALERFFMDNYGLTVDPNTKDMSRARFVSHDPDPYINPDAWTFSAVLEGKQTPSKTQQEKPLETQKAASKTFFDTRRYINPWGDLEKAEACVTEICRRGFNQIADAQKDWFSWACALAELGEDGRHLFHKIASLSPKYDFNENDEKYTYAMHHSSRAGLNKLFAFCKDNGINYADLLRRRPPSQQTPQQRMKVLRANNHAIDLLADRLRLEVDDTPTLADNPDKVKQMLESEDTIERCKALLFESTHNAI